MAGLTPKQEAFCIAIVAGKTAAEAYAIAGYQPKASPTTRQQASSRLLNSKEIARRIAELRMPAAKKAGLTLESHLEDLQRLRNMAVKDGQMSAAIAAEIARGKAAGVWAYVERRELTGKDGGPIEVDRPDGDARAQLRAKLGLP